MPVWSVLIGVRDFVEVFRQTCGGVCGGAFAEVCVGVWRVYLLRCALVCVYVCLFRCVLVCGGVC